MFISKYLCERLLTENGGINRKVDNIETIQEICCEYFDKPIKDRITLEQLQFYLGCLENATKFKIDVEELSNKIENHREMIKKLEEELKAI